MIVDVVTGEGSLDGMTMFAEKSRCRLCEVLSVSSGSPQGQVADHHQISTPGQLSPSPAPLNMFLPHLRDMVLAAWFLKGGTYDTRARCLVFVLLFCS